MRWPKRKKESKYPEAIRPEVLEAAEAAGIADGYKRGRCPATKREIHLDGCPARRRFCPV